MKHGRLAQAEVAGTWLLVCLFVVLLAGCGGPPAGLAEMFPEAETLAGWTVTGEVEVFDHENIFSLVNGQSDAFFAYGFEQAAVRNYEDAAGTTLRITIWQLATPADAFGLFSTDARDTAVDIGNEGHIEPGQRLVFWQARYYVDLFAYPPLSDAQALPAFARATSANLPSGGERPALVDRLPVDGLHGRNAVFFHEEISIQDRLWLGGENTLGLGPETNGVLARYDVDGAEAQLLLVQYPSAEAASAGLVALQNANIDSLAASDVRNDLLGAVLGEIDESAAESLLSDALAMD